MVYNEAARMLTLRSSTTKQQKLPGSVALICAGTADAGVVEECRLMLQVRGAARGGLFRCERGCSGCRPWQASRGPRLAAAAAARPRRPPPGLPSPYAMHAAHVALHMLHPPLCSRCRTAAATPSSWQSLA